MHLDLLCHWRFGVWRPSGQARPRPHAQRHHHHLFFGFIGERNGPKRMAVAPFWSACNACLLALTRSAVSILTQISQSLAEANSGWWAIRSDEIDWDTGAFSDSRYTGTSSSSMRVVSKLSIESFLRSFNNWAFQSLNCVWLNSENRASKGD